MLADLKSRATIIGLALLVLFSSLSFKCDSGNSQSDPLLPAARASDDLAQAIRGMIVVKRKLALERRITPAEERNLTELLGRLTTSDSIFLAQVRAAQNTTDAATKRHLAQTFESVKIAIDDLDKSGVSVIEDQDARRSLTEFLTTMNLSAASINRILE